MGLNRYISDASQLDMSSRAIVEFRDYVEFGDRFEYDASNHLGMDIESVFDVLYYWLVYDSGLLYCPTHEAFLVVAIEVVDLHSQLRLARASSPERPLDRFAKLPVLSTVDSYARGEVKHALLQRNYFDSVKEQVLDTHRASVEISLRTIAKKLGIETNSL